MKKKAIKRLKDLERLRKILIFVIFLNLCNFSNLFNCLYSQPLTRQDVLAQAKKNNPILLKAEKSVKLARLQYQSSITSFLPQVSANAGVSRTDSDGSGWSKDYSYGLSGKLSVFSGFSESSNASSKNIQLKIAEAEYELSKSKRSVVSASRELLKDIGKDSDNGAEIPTATGSFAIVQSTSAPVFGEVLLNIPDYVITKNNLEKSEYDLTSAKSQLYPEISFSGSASKTGDRWPPSNDRRSVSLGLSYPFFPGGRNYYDVKIAQTNKAILEEAFRSTQQQLSSTLSSVWNDFINAVESVKVSQMYFSAAAEQSKITSIKYINGLTSYQDWYTVENDFTNSQKSLLNAKKNAVISEANWKNVLGLEE